MMTEVGLEYRYDTRIANEDKFTGALFEPSQHDFGGKQLTSETRFEVKPNKYGQLTYWLALESRKTQSMHKLVGQRIISNNERYRVGSDRLSGNEFLEILTRPAE
jgi:hypothetical protein